MGVAETLAILAITFAFVLVIPLMIGMVIGLRERPHARARRAAIKAWSEEKATRDWVQWYKNQRETDEQNRKQSQPTREPITVETGVLLEETNNWLGDPRMWLISIFIVGSLLMIVWLSDSRRVTEAILLLVGGIVILIIYFINMRRREADKARITRTDDQDERKRNHPLERDDDPPTPQVKTVVLGIGDDGELILGEVEEE